MGVFTFSELLTIYQSVKNYFEINKISSSENKEIQENKKDKKCIYCSNKMFDFKRYIDNTDPSKPNSQKDFDFICCKCFDIKNFNIKGFFSILSNRSKCSLKCSQCYHFETKALYGNILGFIPVSIYFLAKKLLKKL